MMKDSSMSVADTEDVLDNVEESSPTEEEHEKPSVLENMQTELHSKGNVLTKAWSDLFSFITKYQAELVSKENSVEIAEKEIEQRKKQLEEMKPVVSAGNEDVSKLQDEIQAKERLLSNAQSDLSAKERAMQRMQSDLTCNMDLLETTRSELQDKQKELVSYRRDLEELRSDLTLKQDQILTKDNLLKKLENQLMKENSELREQLELERRALDLEKQSHELTKRNMLSLSQGESRKRQRTGHSASVIEIPDSPPTLDLSDVHGDFGLSNIIAMSESQSTQDLSMKRRHSSGIDTSFATNLTAPPQSCMNNTNRLHHMPSTTSSQSPFKKSSHSPSKTLISPGMQQQTSLSSMSTTAAIPRGHTANTMASSDTFFPLYVSEDTKPNIDSLASSMSMQMDSDLQSNMPMFKPETSSSGNSDSNQGPVPISGPIPGVAMSLSPGGSIDGGADGKSKFMGKLRLKEYYSSHWKPYACPHCPMTCSVAGNLKTHMRRHSGERPYKCPVCPRRFARSDARMRHIRLHTGERPYICRMCDRRFVESGNLRKHMLAVHGTTINIKPPI